MNKDSSVDIPNPATDYHSHPNYFKVYLWLLFFFGISLTVSLVFSPMIALLVIFITAAIKSLLVIKKFMHLDDEPLIMWLVVFVVIFIVGAFLFGVYPDITAVTPQLAK